MFSFVLSRCSYSTTRFVTAQSYRTQVSGWTAAPVYRVRPKSVATPTAWKIPAGGRHCSAVGASVVGSVGFVCFCLLDFFPLPLFFFLETLDSYAFIIFVRVGVSVDQN